MTDMDRLIESIEKWIEVQLEHEANYRKASSEQLAQSRFSIGTTLAETQLGKFVENPTMMKTLKEFIRENSLRVLPFVIEGEWGKALECYIAGIDEFMEQHKEKDTSNNETHYS